MNEEAQAWLLSHLLKFFKGAEQEQTLNHNLLESLWNIRKKMFYPGEDVRFEETSGPVSSHSLSLSLYYSFFPKLLSKPELQGVFFKSRHVIIKDGVKILSLKKLLFLKNRDISGLL